MLEIASSTGNRETSAGDEGAGFQLARTIRKQLFHVKQL
jgi:hypothetical protein